MWLPFCRIYDRKGNCVRKYDFISALAKETAAEVVKNREEWMKYLTTAARLYKYPFREQLLIYAQRPDATACASIELWNERMPDFDVTIVYEGNIETGYSRSDASVVNESGESMQASFPADSLYYEQDGMVVTLGNWLNGRLSCEQIEQLWCELIIPEQKQEQKESEE